MGGSDDPSNLVELSIEDHALAHLALWKQYGLIEDYLAWKGLEGQISKEEILTEIYRKNGRKAGLARKGKPAWNSGKKGVYSEETLAKMKAVRPSETTRSKMRKPKSTTSKMGRYERTPEVKAKLAEATRKYWENKRNQNLDVESL